ncbi:hypothetical protein [Nocardia sp. CDC160]|uniref:hypothetical protein n=1 Tax=Nocardia sp. CDC160 TaxID=3112166 RepID=UPI002DBC6FA3|nr:hypothetical protein [Nocardia sp. CDC160]MEC3917978.1 hypothetical protein [Nocardia sp. CDC160]
MGELAEEPIGLADRPMPGPIVQRDPFGMQLFEHVTTRHELMPCRVTAVVVAR